MTRFWLALLVGVSVHTQIWAHDVGSMTFEILGLAGTVSGLRWLVEEEGNRT